jgi:HEAT repeat protein
MSETLTFQNVLDHLLDSKKDIPQTHLQYYSDLDPKSLRLFLDVWSSVKPERKLLLLERLLSHLDADTVVSYEEIGRALLNDVDAEIRARALGLLAETDDTELVEIFINIFLNDAELAPRLAAANLLGEFVLLGELEELDTTLLREVEEALTAVIHREDVPAIKRRALEAFGYSSREEMVAIIQTAYQRADPNWVTSALVAMGRSHDNRWDDDVISKLLDEDPRIRNAAAQAAGELGIEAAAPILLQILEALEDEDETVIFSAIWSLSQIGGDDARAYLINLIEHTENEDMLELLEDALENLDFNDELNKFDLLSLDEDELQDLDDLDDRDNADDEER